MQAFPIHRCNVGCTSSRIVSLVLFCSYIIGNAQQLMRSTYLLLTATNHQLATVHVQGFIQDFMLEGGNFSGDSKLPHMKQTVCKACSSLGIWGHAPQEILAARRLNLVGFGS